MNSGRVEAFLTSSSQGRMTALCRCNGGRCKGGPLQRGAATNLDRCEGGCWTARTGESPAQNRLPISSSANLAQFAQAALRFPGLRTLLAAARRLTTFRKTAIIKNFPLAASPASRQLAAGWGNQSARAGCAAAHPFGPAIPRPGLAGGALPRGDCPCKAID